MNCKQGDLAIITMFLPLYPDAVGKIVRCERFEVCLVNGPSWRVSPRLGENKPAITRGVLRNVQGDWVKDACLRPIRDPGNDARDETLEWLKMPSQPKKEPA